MPKSTIIDGEMYRTRRGKLVKIPDEWVGNFTTRQTIRKRDSKLTNKLARDTKWNRNRAGSTGPLYIKYRDAKELGNQYIEDVYGE